MDTMKEALKQSNIQFLVDVNISQKSDKKTSGKLWSLCSKPFHFFFNVRRKSFPLHVFGCMKVRASNIYCFRSKLAAEKPMQMLAT